SPSSPRPVLSPDLCGTTATFGVLNPRREVRAQPGVVVEGRLPRTHQHHPIFATSLMHYGRTDPDLFSWKRQKRMDVVDWLLDSDPAIRWQVMRALADAPEEDVAAERARVATEGWGARLLALQKQDGHWDKHS